MARPKKPYRLTRDPSRSKYWQYKTPAMGSFRSTGRTDESQARQWVEGRLGIRDLDSQMTFDLFAGPFFTPDCPYQTRRDGLGHHIKEETVRTRRRNLDLHIMPAWGGVRLCDITPEAVEDWIAALGYTGEDGKRKSYSGQTKQHVLNAMKIILGEANRKQLIVFHPRVIENPSFKNSHPQILSPDDASILFGDDFEHWCETLHLGVFCALLYSGGLRTQDARALEWEQVYFEYQGIVVDRAVDSDGREADPKGGDAGAVLLPKKTMEMLKGLNREGRLVFPGGDGGFLSPHTPAKALMRSCKRAGVKHVSPHGLKHSYTTRIGRLIPEMSIDIREIALKEFTRHKSKQMAMRYYHDEFVEDLRQKYERYGDEIDRFWVSPKEGESDG